MFLETNACNINTIHALFLPTTQTAYSTTYSPPFAVVAGAVPLVADAVPVVAGAVPLVAGAVPLVADAVPVVAGAVPLVADAVPVVAGAVPVQFLHVVAGAVPVYYNEVKVPDLCRGSFSSELIGSSYQFPQPIPPGGRYKSGVLRGAVCLYMQTQIRMATSIPTVSLNDEPHYTDFTSPSLQRW